MGRRNGLLVMENKPGRVISPDDKHVKSKQFANELEQTSKTNHSSIFISTI